MPDFGEAFEDDWEETGNGPRDSDAFDKYVAAKKRAQIKEREDKVFVKPFEPRCHVCTHSFRDIIDSALIKSDISFSELAKRMPPAKNGRQLDHRQLSNHAKKHLGHGDAAIRAILEEEADLASRDYKEGVRGAITHRGGLEVAFRKAYEDIVNGTASVEPRDMVKIAETLQKWDTQTHAVQVDLLRAQVGAIEEAIKRKVPRELWVEIVKEARSIMEREGLAELPPGRETQPIVDAEVVEDAVAV